MDSIIRRPRIISNVGTPFAQVPSLPDAATTAWVAAVVANGGTVSPGRQSIVDVLIKGLKTDSIWTTALDRLWLHAGENQPSALTDLVSLSLATNVNSMSFTTDRGFLSDGATNYINSVYNASTNGVNYTLNSAAMGAWSVDAGNNTDHRLLGAGDGTNVARIAAGSNYFFGVNASAETIWGATGPQAEGLWSSSRTSPTLTTLYINSTSLQTDAHVSATIPNFAMYIGAQNDFGSPSWGGGTQARIGATYFGRGLSSGEIAALASRLQTYMTAVGA